MKVTVFIATSLDGFIARNDGNLDWLTEASQSATGEEYGYDELVQSIDYLVMGRGTFEAVAQFPDWPYEGTKVIILSKKIEVLPKGLENKAELYRGSIEKLYERFQQEDCQGLYIDGGKTVQSFLRAGLVTDIIITKIPILLGEGLPLFGKLEKDIPLKLIEVKGFPSGFVRMHYQPLGTSS